MGKQMHDWKVLSDMVFDKVSEYLDSQNGWGEDANLWLDIESHSVTLAEPDQVLPGESIPAKELVRVNDSGSLEPDGDLIEDYVNRWFDFRTGD